MMLLHDRVTVLIFTQLYDQWGTPIPGSGTTEEFPLPAEVQPINADTQREQHTGVNVTATRFRIILNPTDVDLSSATGVLWGDYELATEGEVEPHMLRGRLHHLELVARYEKNRR